MVWSSCGVDPFVSSHTRACGHFTGRTINDNKNNRRWREEKDKRLFKTAKCRNVKFGSLTFFVSYMWLTWELSENLTQPPKMLTHLVIVFTALCLRSWLYTHPPTALDPRLWADWPAPRLEVESLTLCSGASLLTWPTSFHETLLFVGSSYQNRQSGSSRQPTLFKIEEDKFPSFATHRRTHIETHTHKCSLSCHTL